MTAVFRFYGKYKAALAPHKVFLKFVAFKIIVFVNWLQGVSTETSAEYRLFWSLRLNSKDLLIMQTARPFPPCLFECHQANHSPDI
jgi:hypothetical protein